MKSYNKDELIVISYIEALKFYIKQTVLFCKEYDKFQDCLDRKFNHGYCSRKTCDLLRSYLKEYFGRELRWKINDIRYPEQFKTSDNKPLAVEHEDEEKDYFSALRDILQHHKGIIDIYLSDIKKQSDKNESKRLDSVADKTLFAIDNLLLRFNRSTFNAFINYINKRIVK